MDALELVYPKQIEPYLEEGVSQEAAETQTANDFLPDFRKNLRSSYLHCLKWYIVVSERITPASHQIAL